jgi:tetratricopeptide (TPR) repeat protein
MKRTLAILVIAVATALPAAAQTSQGIALYDQGRFEDAKRVLAAQPNDAQALYTLGRIAMAQNDPDKAEEYFKKAIARKPNVSDYHLALGNAYGQQAIRASVFGKASLAGKVKDELLRAVALDPNNIDARQGLIEFYVIAPSIMGGSETKAREQAEEIRKRDASAAHRAFARIYLGQKNKDLARKEYIDWVREQPNAAKSHYGLASFYLAVDKNYKAAGDEFEAALKVDPNFMPALFQIGHLAVLTSSNFNRGEEALKRYLAYKPKEDEPGLHRAYYWLGGIYEKQGNKVAARQNYQASLRLNPSAKEVNEALKRVS